MNSNRNENSSNNDGNQTNREASKMITLTAFLIGYILIDHLDSNEQNAVGNFFMLIGQTLCTSGGENFKRDWAPYSNPINTPPNSNRPSNNNNYAPSDLFPSSSPNSNNTTANSSSMTREQTIDMLNRTRNIFNQQIDKLK